MNDEPHEGFEYYNLAMSAGFDPELYDGYHMKTAILLEEESFDEAVEFAKKASEKFPDDADLTYDYANALAMPKKYDESLQVLELHQKH